MKGSLFLVYILTPISFGIKNYQNTMIGKFNSAMPKIPHSRFIYDLHDVLANKKPRQALLHKIQVVEDEPSELGPSDSQPFELDPSRPKLATILVDKPNQESPVMLSSRREVVSPEEPSKHSLYFPIPKRQEEFDPFSILSEGGYYQRTQNNIPLPRVQPRQYPTLPGLGRDRLRGVEIPAQYSLGGRPGNIDTPEIYFLSRGKKGDINTETFNLSHGKRGDVYTPPRNFYLSQGKLEDIDTPQQNYLGQTNTNFDIPEMYYLSQGKRGDAETQGSPEQYNLPSQQEGLNGDLLHILQGKDGQYSLVGEGTQDQAMLYKRIMEILNRQG